MTIEAAVTSVRERVAAEDGAGTTDWTQARADALQGLRTAVLTVWEQDPGDSKFVDGLVVGSIMAFTTAAQAYDTNQMSLPAYLDIRERAVRVLNLRDELIGLVAGAAAVLGPDAGNFLN